MTQGDVASLSRNSLSRNVSGLEMDKLTSQVKLNQLVLFGTFKSGINGSQTRGLETNHCCGQQRCRWQKNSSWALNILFMHLCYAQHILYIMVVIIAHIAFLYIWVRKKRSVTNSPPKGVLCPLSGAPRWLPSSPLFQAYMEVKETQMHHFCPSQKMVRK